ISVQDYNFLTVSFLKPALGKIHIATTKKRAINKINLLKSGRAGEPLQLAKPSATIITTADTIAIAGWSPAEPPRPHQEGWARAVIPMSTARSLPRSRSRDGACRKAMVS